MKGEDSMHSAVETTDGLQAANDNSRWSELTGFRRDMLVAVSRLEKADKPCYGLAIQELLEKQHGTVHHSHLYTNLEALVADGYLEKGEIDARTNKYALTPETRDMLEAAAHRLADACNLAVVDPTDGESADTT